MLNNKHVLDFTGNTDEPLDLGKESFRIFIKAVELKYSSYQNTISEKYWKTDQEQRQNLTQYLCIVNNKYTFCIYSINIFVYVNYANYIHLQKFYFTVYPIYIIYNLKKKKTNTSPSLILLLKYHHICLLRSLVITSLPPCCLLRTRQHFWPLVARVETYTCGQAILGPSNMFRCYCICC